MARRRRGLSNITRQEFRRASTKLRLLAGNLDKKTPAAMRLIGEEIMLDVKSSRPGAGVPVDEGTLRSSGRVDATGKLITLSFGGAAAPYALVQHEDTSLQHTVGEARYLVRGVERWRPNGVSAIRARAELQAAIDKLAVSRKGRRRLRR